MARLDIRVDETGTKVKADTGSVSGTAQMAGLIRAVNRRPTRHEQKRLGRCKRKKCPRA